MIDRRAQTWAAATAAAFSLLACQESKDGTGAETSVESESTQEQRQATQAQAQADPGKPADGAAGDKECCIGKNECKGKGGCAVEGKNSCAGKNDCKGQGGCNMHCPK